MNTPAADRLRLRPFATLSIVAAVVTIGLKMAAYGVTGSVGLLSDALESLVNLGAALLAFLSLTISARPPDESHAFGHDKVEFFAAGLEGLLVLVAAAGIGWAAVERLLAPMPLEALGVGSFLAVGAAAVNLATGLVLHRAGKRHGSPTLEADGVHLLTDVWSTALVLVGLAAVKLTGWLVLDPVIALAVAVIIVRTGLRLVWRAIGGLMDEALPEAEQARLRAVLGRFCHDDIAYHALRTRRSGARRFASVHVLVPPTWTVAEGHALCEQIERALRAELPNLSIFTHLEPLGDPSAMHDIPLDREDG